MPAPLPSLPNLLRRFPHGLRKSLGQHFLVDPNVSNTIAAAVDQPEVAGIIEIGPGAGSLTLALAALGRPIVAVEKDGAAVAYLRSAFANQPQISFIEADATEWAPPEDEKGWNVAANLPYNVGTQIYFHLVEQRQVLNRLVLMFQREVAERFLAKPRTKAYGILSIVGSYYHHCHRCLQVPPGAFKPPPKVASTVLTFDPKPPALPPEMEPLFRQVVRQAFQTRRKMLVNTLQNYRGMDKAAWTTLFAELGFSAMARPEELSLDDFCALTRALHARAPGGAAA